MQETVTDELLRRSIRGEVTPDDAESVTRWRRQSALNERRYERLARLMDVARSVESRVDAGTPPPPDLLIWAAEAQARRRRATWRGAETAGPERRWWWGVGIAAATLIVAAAARQFVFRPADSSQLAGLGADRFVTGKAEFATVQLKDGTLVRLGPESRLQILSTIGSREVELEGRAFLAVAKDPSRPFRVKTRAGDAIVLGTRFQIDAAQAEVKVLVVEGRVGLSAQGQAVEVAAGQTSMVANGVVGPIIKVPDIAAATAWVRRLLVFQATPLAEAMKEVDDVYGIQTEILDTVLANHTLTMWFSDRTLEEVTTSICAVVAAQCWIDAERLTIRPMGRR